MTSQPPNSFSNPLERWVFENSVASVVLVTLNPRCPKAVMDAMNIVCPLPKVAPAEVTTMKEERLEDCKMPRCSTGSIIEGAPEGKIYVLTCVHSVDHVFNAETPITDEGINNLFNISILCDHAECKYLEGRVKTRRYVPGIVIQVECSKDLMLIQVDASDLQKKCKEKHRPLKLAQKFPEPLERIVMISWLPYKPRTACLGETSHPGREYNVPMSHAPDAYIMKLSEVNIMGDSGSSGAVLLDGAADITGIFHSGAPGTLSYSYFVSFNDLKNQLITWGVLAGEQMH